MASFTIEDWMISEKNLGGHELLAFALIHQCTQNGDGCWYGGYDRLAVRIGAKQRGTIEAIKSLAAQGLIEKGEAVISGRVRNVLKSTVTSSAKTCAPSAKNAEQKQNNAEQTHLQKTTVALQKMQRSSAKNADDNLDNSSIPPSGVDTIVSPPSTPKGSELSVERIYKLYPTKCPVKGRPTGKSSSDKKKIERLLKTMPEEKLSGIILRYLDECVSSGTPIKNLSTLLNNLPDYDEPELISEPTPVAQQNNNRPTFTFVGTPRERG